MAQILLNFGGKTYGYSFGTQRKQRFGSGMGKCEFETILECECGFSQKRVQLYLEQFEINMQHTTSFYYYKNAEI